MNYSIYVKIILKNLIVKNGKETQINLVKILKLFSLEEIL